MTHDAIRLSFKIDAYEPDTIPMARLAEYMSDLATMIGEKANVHFVQLEQGCVQLVHEVQFEAYPKIEARVRSVRDNDAPPDAMSAYRNLNRRLAEDNTFAYYQLPESSVLLDFLGIKAPKPIEIAPVEQPSTIDGKVVGVGGRGTGNMAPVLIDVGDNIHTCVTSRTMAKQLAHYLYEDERRFHGKAIWQRDEQGAWTLKKFEIQSHDALDGAPLTDVVDELRAVPSELGGIRDPWGDIMQMRQEDGEPN